jgi:hypothetical protein
MSSSLRRELQASHRACSHQNHKTLYQMDRATKHASNKTHWWVIYFLFISMQISSIMIIPLL